MGKKKFTIKPNCKFTDGKTYYIILGRGVVFNNDSEVVTDKTLLIFEVIDPAPSIVSNPNDTTAASPFSGVFTCSARGYGVPVFIEWRRNNSDLPSSSYSFTQILSSDIIASTLVIPNVTNEDVGNYYCVAWNKRKTAQSTHANLLFAGKPIQPWVVVHNAQIRLTINTYNLSMKCLPISSSLFYNWEKQNSNLPSRVHDVSSSTLIITNLRPEDSGEYRCTVGNYTGNMTSDYVKVTIEASPPIITKQPTNTTVSFFGQAIFECKVQAVGKITIIWKRDQSILPVTATVNNIISANEITSILTITGVAGYYKGYYYCTAENEAGQTNSRFAELSVQVPDPEILRPLENITVLFKKMATLNCLASSYGTLMYDWKRLDGNQVSLFASQAYVPNQYLKANFIVVTYQLTIPNVQLSDEGWHCCVATNEGGESEKCVWLEVDTAPVITKAPIDITVKEYSYDINPLNCSASGMGPINYQWEKYQPSDDSWIIPSYKTVNSTTPKLIFSVITEEDGGVYHCIATNDDGSVVSDNATITVYGPPIITSVSSDTTSVEGSKVNLMCNATNDVDALDEVKIVWIHKTSSQSEQELEMNGKISFYNKTDSSTGKIHSVLLFDSVYHTDDGEYICRAFNHPQSYSEVNVSLIVQFPPILILFPSQSPLNVNVNQPVQLHCIGTGLPIPKIQWSKDGIVVTTAEPTQNFVTVDASNPSTAVYTCVGTNTINGMVHKQSSSITVIVAESCPMLANPANGRVIVVGTSAFYVCNTGYTVVGNPFNTCLNGKWVSPPALCN